MTDLSTLQYPRHLHKAGESFRIVQSAAECDEAMDDGWVLRPGDPPRSQPHSDVEPSESDTLTEQTAPKKPGRPKKL